MIKINETLLNKTSKKGEVSIRKRANHNFHKQPSDLLQRMLNAGEPGTYIRPHKHDDPPKREVFLLLRGKAVVIEFNDNGNISEHEILSHENGCYGVEIKPGNYHSFIILEKNSVFYEIKDGPYNPESDKKFADWAPEEGDTAAQEFMKKILKQIHINQF